MSRKHNTKHNRGKSNYPKRKNNGYDRYGSYAQGEQKTADNIAGRVSWHRDH